MKRTKGYEREKSLSASDYLTKEYFSFKQLWSFSEQIFHIKKINPNSLLEIGVGNGFVSSFLKKIGIVVETVDINENLKPDVTISVLEIDEYYFDRRFDLISCCEVLEHLEYEYFDEIISKFSKISNLLFLTLPTHNRIYGFGGYVQLPRYYKWVSFWIKLPMKSKLPKAHFWEINSSKETSHKNIIKILNKYYGSIDSALFKAHPSQYYFICKK